MFFLIGSTGHHTLIPSQLRILQCLETSGEKDAAGYQQVSHWTDNCGFRFSTAKVEVSVMFLSSCVEQIRLLGLVFDIRLTCIPHIRFIKAACMKTLSPLRVLAHSSWGMDRHFLRYTRHLF